MASILHLLHTLASFGVVLGVLVFIHELGHYLAARWRGVQVEAFSIGFGKKLVSWTDRHGTVWKICALPLGGYVKMHGMGEEGGPDPSMGLETGEEVKPNEAGAFWRKSVGSRAIVFAAGPAANFALAIFLFSALYMVVGQPTEPSVLPAIVGDVAMGSAADKAGLQPDDAIVAIDGVKLAKFEDLRRIVSGEPDRDITVLVRRGAQDLTIKLHTGTDTENGAKIGRLGITAGGIIMQRLNPAAALVAGSVHTWELLAAMLAGLVHILVSGQGVSELGGPIAIASMSGQVARQGAGHLIEFIAFLSVNLGLVNLLPIPVLDGGHLMFCAAEALRGRPVPARAQDVGYRVGFALIASLFLVISFNDLLHTGLLTWIAKRIG